MAILAVAVSGRGLVDPDEPVIHVDDEGFDRGRAAFETLRVYGGRPFRLGDHLRRLAGSAARLGLPPVEDALVERVLAQALEGAGRPDSWVRITFTPGRAGRNTPVVLAVAHGIPEGLEEQRARGIRLATVERGGESPRLMGGVKSTSYALNMVAVADAQARGADDALFLGTDRTVLEGPTSNIWWRNGTRLRTPALDLGILAGVTRTVMLELVGELGFAVEEGAFGVDDLAAAEEAFTSSSVREVMPVIALDGAPVGEGRPGAAAAAFQEGLRRAACR